MNPETYSERLMKLRIKAGLSQGEMSIKSGINRQNIYLWEAGKRKPDLDSLIDLSDFFKVTIDYIAKGK